MVSLNLCKEYLNMAAFKSLTLDKESNIFIYRKPTYVLTCRRYRLVSSVICISRTTTTVAF